MHKFIVSLVLLLACLPAPSRGQDLSDLLPINEAYKFSADARTPGVIKLHWTIAPDYYLYRGQMRFTGGDGVTLGAAQLPDGRKYRDEYLGDVEVYHNGIDARIPYTLAPGTQRIRLAVRYQGCHEVDPKICYPPHTENLDLEVPAAGAAASGEATAKPTPAKKDGAVEATAKPSSAVATTAAGKTTTPAPATNDIAGGAGSNSPATAADTPAVVANPTAPVAKAGKPAPTPGGAGASSATNPATAGLLMSLLLALAGGLVLNLMPCVLPILSIKVVGILESGESPQRRRGHALVYTAGVLCSFAAIGLAVMASRSAGHALGWGAQLQQPMVVGVLACVMVAVGLSMSGVVHFGTSLGNLGHGLASRGGWMGDFFTGVLAVVVASPCVAPFMGTALAYAFLAPPLAAVLVFLALGLGLSLPFLLIGFVPALGKLLPRPGAWMETLKQVLAFPMYLTAVWLVWVLANQRGADAVALVLAAAVVLAMALWWFERSRDRGTWAKALAVALALVAAVPLYWLGQVPPASARAASAETGVVAFSPQKLAELRQAGMPVFVDMTADWCITCKVNEKAVFTTDAFKQSLEKNDAYYLVGDFTNEDPDIAAFLKAHGAVGVPLYAVYPRSGGDGELLQTVLTNGIIDTALTRAANR